MKKNIVAVALVVFLLSVSLAGCVGVVIGSGNVETKEMDFRDFSRISAGQGFEIEIVQSDSYSIRITANDNLFQYIQVSKAGETLKIGLKPTVCHASGTLRAEITVPELHELELSGMTHGSIKGFSSSEDFDLELSGASSLDISDMEASNIEIELSGASRASGDIRASGDAQLDLSGASKAELTGSANDILIEASGASQLGLDNFPVNNADVELSGASRATVNLDGRLDADLSGASKLSYIGEPTMGDIHTSGGSTVSKK